MVLMNLLQDSNRNTDIENRLMDTVGEGKGGTTEREALRHICYQI